MSVEASPDRKKQVCTTLTGIVKGSPLAGAIEPSAFFMQLNANYGALVRGQTLDLNLLWTTMSQQHAPDQLVALFLKFGDAGARLGLDVVLPPPLAQLSPQERQARLARLDSGRSPAPPPTSAPRTPGRTELSSDVQAAVHGLTPLPLPASALREIPAAQTPGRGPAAGMGLPAAATPARGMPAPQPGGAPVEATPLPVLFEEYEPTPLSEAALAGIPDEQQRRIISTLVGALKATEAGPFLSAPQLSYFLASRFNLLCDGTNFFFQGVYDAVLELQGVEEKHVYQAAVRFRRWLARVGLQLAEPAWKLDAATRARLEEQAAKVPLDTYSPIARVMAPHAHTPQPPASTAPEADPGPTTAEARQDQRLRKWGLRGLSPRAMMVLRLGLGVLVIGVALLIRVLLDPISSLDVADYRAVIPLTETVTYEGRWLGTVDDKAWRALPLEKRQKALRDLTAILVREGRIQGARLVQANKSIVGYDVKGDMRMADSYLYVGIESQMPTR